MDRQYGGLCGVTDPVETANWHTSKAHHGFNVGVKEVHPAPTTKARLF